MIFVCKVTTLVDCVGTQLVTLLSADNVVSLLRVADRHGLTQLKTRAVRFATRDALTLVMKSASKQLLNMTANANLNLNVFNFCFSRRYKSTQILKNSMQTACVPSSAPRHLRSEMSLQARSNALFSASQQLTQNRYHTNNFFGKFYQMNNFRKI